MTIFENIVQISLFRNTKMKLPEGCKHFELQLPTTNTTPIAYNNLCSRIFADSTCVGDRFQINIVTAVPQVRLSTRYKKHVWMSRSVYHILLLTFLLNTSRSSLLVYFQINCTTSLYRVAVQEVFINIPLLEITIKYDDHNYYFTHPTHSV